MAPDYVWSLLWEHFAQRFGGGWPEHNAHLRVRPIEESPEYLHQQLDALEERIAQRFVRRLAAEASRPERGRRATDYDA